MALEITGRDLEKQEEISKMVCKCALLSMDEAGEHGDKVARVPRKGGER